MDQDSAKLEWPKEAVLHLIGMWETFECLYNPKHKFYHNKNARYQALNELAANLDDLIPGIGSAEVKAKINYLRGQFTREVGKCNNKKSGAGTDEFYVPSAFRYKKLSFLSDFVKVRKGESSYLSPLDSSQTSQQLEEELSPPGQSKKRARQKDETLAASKENDVLEAAMEALKSISQETPSDMDTNDDAFCKFLVQEFQEVIISSSKQLLVFFSCNS